MTKTVQGIFSQEKSSKIYSELTVLIKVTIAFAILTSHQYYCNYNPLFQFQEVQISHFAMIWIASHRLALVCRVIIHITAVNCFISHLNVELYVTKFCGDFMFFSFMIIF